jgi:hypothetical protein
VPDEILPREWAQPSHGIAVMARGFGRVGGAHPAKNPLYLGVAGLSEIGGGVGGVPGAVDLGTSIV